MLVQGTTVVIPASHGGSLADYLRSLDRLLRLNPARALPGARPGDRGSGGADPPLPRASRASARSRCWRRCEAGAVDRRAITAAIYPRLRPTRWSRWPARACLRICSKLESEAARARRRRWTVAGDADVYLAPPWCGRSASPGRRSCSSTPCSSVATGQQLVALGDFAQLIPPLAYAGFTMWLARQSRGQVRVFWNLNAIHGLMWAIGQARLDLLRLVRRRRAGRSRRPIRCSSCRAFRWRPRSTAGPSAIGRAGCSTSSCSTWC